MLGGGALHRELLQPLVRLSPGSLPTCAGDQHRRNDLATSQCLRALNNRKIEPLRARNKGTHELHKTANCRRAADKGLMGRIDCSPLDRGRDEAIPFVVDRAGDRGGRCNEKERLANALCNTLMAQPRDDGLRPDVGDEN